MARIHVYPPYRALVGSSELELDFAPGTTLRAVLRLLAERYPAFREFAEAPTSEFLWGQLIVHANNEIVGLDSRLQPTDTLDLLPPIAGGAGRSPLRRPRRPNAPEAPVSDPSPPSELSRALEALRTSEARLRLATIAARIGLFEIDWVTRRREWSAELRGMLAVPDDLDISADEGLIDRILPPEHRARYRACVAASLDPTGSGEFEDEHEVIKLDGTRGWMLSRGKTFFADGPDGSRAVRTLGLMLDISERKALEQIQQDFIANVGHELRNPLATIRGFAQLMRRRRAYDPAAVEAIIGQTVQLDRLIGDLLTASHLGAAAPELRRRRLDLVAAVRSAVEQARAASEAHSLRLEAPSEPLEGEWDADRLGQVLANLLGNAIKYSPDGGEIVVRVADQGHEALVSIRDAGLGIEPESLPRLFERFFRVGSGAREIQGLGLGLYITRELIEAHDGRIWAESDGPGRGSTFCFTLPLDQPRSPIVNDRGRG